jgi:hypothetical protein
MLPSTTLRFVQQHPTVTANSPEFRNRGLRDEECQELAYQLIEFYSFIEQTTPVYDSKGYLTKSIKKYFRALIDVDRSAIEYHFPGFNVAQAKRSMVHEIIDWREELYRLYVK